ncbi:MAG TPA: NAD-dependent epimerase/dehydratase family protein [Caulobacteraceae bacterium]|nr:NAD-dependent epimerase/dehydratase family protein [Caulobacteraceae bacterium]
MDRRDVVRGVAALAGAAAWPAATAEPVRKAPRSLRILILGGTGFIGPHEVDYALARGHKLTLFNRGRSPHAWSAPVEELIGDRTTGDLKALEGGAWDVCIDNPTTLPFWVRDVGHTLAGKVGQYIFISTISVYAANDTPGADETAALEPYTGKDPLAETQKTLADSHLALYGPLKAASEREAQRQFPGKVTIVRPGLISGPGDETDRFTYWPVRLARGGEVAAPGDGKDPVQLIDARDLARWVIRLAESRTFGNFNATGPARPLTMDGFLTEVQSGVGATEKLVWIPTDFLAAQKVSPWSDMPVWVPGVGETAGFARRDIRRALAAGLTFRPLTATAADALAWFGTLPPDRKAHLKAGLAPDRETAVLAAWKAHAG